MSKSRLALIFAALSAGALSTASAAVVGRDAAVCKAGQPSVQVHVMGLKRPSGEVKVYLYSGSGYLQKGGKLRKVVVPVAAPGPIDVCVAVPKPGRYAVAVHHDLNANGSRDLSDGGGYSRNPRLSLTSLKPEFGRTVIDVGSSPKVVPVLLQYRRGLSMGPVVS